MSLICHQLYKVLQFSSSGTDFRRVFEYFCSSGLPSNAKLRQDLITCLQKPSITAALMPFEWYERQNILPDMPTSWRAKVYQQYKAREGRICSIDIPNVSDVSLQSLSLGNMINDEIVDGYLELIRKSGVIISTTRLLENCTTKIHPYDRRMGQAEYLSTQAFIPIHHTSNHWTFARIVPRRPGVAMRIEHFDSLPHRAIPPHLKIWIKQYFPDATLERGSSPKQDNKTDCGLFMLLGIRMMASGSRHLSPSEADEIMPEFRGRVLAEILASTLNPTDLDYANFVEKDDLASEKLILHQLRRTVFHGEGNNSDCPIVFIDSPEDTSLQVGGDIPCSFAMPADHHAVETAAIQAGSVVNEAVDDLQQQANFLSLSSVSNEPLQSVQSSISPVLKKEYSDVVCSYIRSFGTEQLMVEMLKGAVTAGRIKQRSGEGESLAFLWVGLGCEDSSQHALWARFDREKFSRKFFGELFKLGVPRSSRDKRIRPHMQKLLDCEHDEKNYKAARGQAQRSSIWSELVMLTTGYLGYDTSVAICAAPESTHAVELLGLDDRADFLAGIESRLRNPEDHLLDTLGKARLLFDAVTTNMLPVHTLAIERQVDLKLISFEAALSLDEAPLRLQLPRLRSSDGA
jgi:hypothetical protein